MRHTRVTTVVVVMGTLLLAWGCQSVVTDLGSSGSIRFSVSASGEARDTVFLLTLDSDTTSYEVYADSAETFAVAVGTHSIELEGIAANCSVSGDNPRYVEVIAGLESDVSFVVTCAVHGSAKVTIATTGEDIDDMYTLDFNSGYRTVLVGPNQFVTLSLPVGAYTVNLSGVADNCAVSGENPIAAEVAANQTLEIAFSVACVARS